jgi:hypothetical protein
LYIFTTHLIHHNAFSSVFFCTSGFKNIASAAGQAGEIIYTRYFKAQLYEHEIHRQDPAFSCFDTRRSSFGSWDCVLAAQKLDLGGDFAFLLEKLNRIRGLCGPEIERSRRGWIAV